MARTLSHGYVEVSGELTYRVQSLNLGADRCLSLTLVSSDVAHLLVGAVETNAQ